MGQRISHRVTREVIVHIRLVEDVCLQSFVETGDRYVAFGGEVFFVGYVNRIGAPRVEARVSAAAAGFTGGLIDVEFECGFQLIETWTGNLLCGSDTHGLLVGKFKREVGAGENVGIFFPVGGCLRLVRGVVEIISRRRLVDILYLRTNITPETERAEILVQVQFSKSCRNLFFYAPRLLNHVRIGIVARDKRIVVLSKYLRNIPGQYGRRSRET